VRRLSDDDNRALAVAALSAAHELLHFVEHLDRDVGEAGVSLHLVCDDVTSLLADFERLAALP